MADTATVTKNAPGWVDVSAKDAAAARTHYGTLFAWDTEVFDDPAAGGYGMFRLGGKDVGGVGPQQPEDQSPPHWTMYVIVDDADATTAKAKEAGGAVYAEPFDVLEEGRMAILADPSGAVFGLWQPKKHGGWEIDGTSGSVAWVELNARGIEKAKPFYQKVFGWDPTKSTMSGAMDYTEFQIDGKSIAGGMEAPEMIPAEIPSHWLIYFAVDDVDATTARNKELGGTTLGEPFDIPPGRMAVLADPQGAAFAVIKPIPPPATS